MNQDERFNILTRGITEVVTPEEAGSLLAKGGEPRAYWGIEPSGLFHIGQALIGARKVRDLASLGFEVNILLADWHALINDKLDGTFESIQVCGRYLEDCLKGLGADSPKIHYLVGSDLVDEKEYWERVVRVSKASSVARIKRAMTIMGRSEEEADSDASKLIYPAMQAADIFHQELDLAIGGMDQRHAHMLARDVAPKLGYKKPVALHWPLLMGLQGGGRMDAAESKMSKSNPDSAIFLHDEPTIVQAKLKKAFCPQGQVDDNPVLEHARLAIFPELGRIDITRPEKFGGDLHFGTYEELAAAYGAGKLHPMDLKSAVAGHISEILGPVQKYLAENPSNFNRLREIIEARK